VIGAVGTALALAGCAVPYDDDGEVPVGFGRPAPPAAAAATRVVVDTDLGGDDLAALAFLLRHPEVDVEAITVAGAGLVGCDPGVDIVADLLTALAEPAVPIACTEATPGPGALELPHEWRAHAETGTGIPRPASSRTPAPGSAEDLIKRLAVRYDDLVLVALGPLTTVAELAETAPRALARLAGVHAMGGSVDGPAVDGVAEWNAAADPTSFEIVLGAGVALTIVPEDAVPDGTPDALAVAPVLGLVAADAGIPRWWDLATAASLVTDPAESTTGRWVLDETIPGRLVRAGDGDVQVVRSFDAEQLAAAYAQTFA
jgi:hypothetical protein